MIEVFKTNVTKQSQAKLLADLICLSFTGYRASFDLEDCDKVLRIASDGGEICNAGVKALLESFGYRATELEEDPAPDATVIETNEEAYELRI
ncbi:hypothetical protein [Dyadobacter sp. 676]|uniref:Uncharacterized protein n=1 Tax=Dyadobacter sp. 676 TaxID=3088362 RepID=A0AAU8FJK8_9BACT